MCNDRPFYMVVLVGYSVAGRRIVDVVRSVRMLHVLLQVPATIVADQAVARGETVSLSRGVQQSGTIDI